MAIKFYKLRALVLVHIIKLLTKILFVEMPPIVSVTALISKKGRLLFVDLSYLQGLGFPGGVVQEGETLEEALKREVSEETGLKVVNSKYFGSVKAINRGVPGLSAVFLVGTSGKPRGSKEGPLVWLEPEKVLGKLAYKDNDLALINNITSEVV